jgi:hypothetical protein
MGYVERQGSHGWFVVRLGDSRLSFCPDTILSTTSADDGSEVSVCRRSREHSREELKHALNRQDQKRKSETESEGIKIRCWVLRLGAYSIGNRGQKEHEWLVLGRSSAQSEYFERVGWGLVKSHDEEERVFAQETTGTMTLV